MGGLAITAAAERAPDKIAKIVYLAAFMPASACRASTTCAHLKTRGNARPADAGGPRVAGALRIDPRSGDAYRELAKRALYDDVPQADFEAVANLMSCDAGRAVRDRDPDDGRTLGRDRPSLHQCLQDRVILPALQQRFIDEADAFAPGNPTHVHQLDSSHSPFMSQPAVLAGVPADIAKARHAPGASARARRGGCATYAYATDRSRQASRDRAASASLTSTSLVGAPASHRRRRRSPSPASLTPSASTGTLPIASRTLSATSIASSRFVHGSSNAIPRRRSGRTYPARARSTRRDAPSRAARHRRPHARSGR